jgi:RAP domain
LLFDAIARAARVRIAEFNDQALSNTAWAFAKLNHEAPALLDNIARAALVRIDEFSPQALSNTSWAFATLNHEAVPLLFDAIARAATVKIKDFKPQELSNTAWAFATMKHEAPLLFDAIARAAPVRINNFTPQGFSNIAWSFATLNHKAPPAVLDAIARAAQVQINEFKPQELANTAWAYATLNHEVPSLFEAIARALQACINQFNVRDLANTAWSFAIFNVESNSFISADSPFAQTLQSRDPSVFSIEELGQLHQLQLWYREQTGATSWYPDELIKRCQQAFVSAEASPSRLQKDVEAALGKLQDVSCVEVEVSTVSGYTLDAVVTFRGERIGVEVDGPAHFVGQSQSPNGATVLKHRQLRALEDCKLVTIPYWNWNEMDKGSNEEKIEKKTRYLQNLLNEALVVSR